MKLIHCADLHLDAKMNANLDKENAKIRRGEILHTFERMVEYAAKNQVEAILIAGDMFDTKNISATARNTVLHTITSHPQIRFYYLRGNHDNDNFLSGLENVPDNLLMFGSQWITYEEAEGKVAISGLELSAENVGAAHVSLVPDARKFNIVMLHGQEADSESKDKAEIVPIKVFRNKGIDYLALGHIHGYKKEQLDARGIYCYPGCLVGRGFDECGEHGFVELDVDVESSKFTHTFVPFAWRKMYTAEVDVTDCNTTAQMVEKTKAFLKELGCEPTSMIKIVLVGTIDVECEKDTAYFLAGFQPEYFYVKVYDKTKLKVDVEDYLLDTSLKGEYVRQVMNDSGLSEEDKKIIIRYGLQAIAGEEVQ